MSGPLVIFERCLLVEDDPAHAHLISRALKGVVGDLSQAASLGSAVAAANSQAFSLVITDLNLPDSSAEETVRRLREVFPSVPLLVLTSSTSLREAVNAIKQGADDFIVKEFGPDFQDVFSLALSRTKKAHEERAEKLRLERHMQALRAAIEGSSDGLAVARADQTIEYCNQAFSAFMNRIGAPDLTVSGIFSGKIIDAPRVLQSWKERDSDLVTGGVWHTEIELKESKGAAYEISLSRAERPTGAAASGSSEAYTVVWVRDVSARRRRDELQRQILATTTHDLKGPLGAILLSAELLTELTKAIPKAAELATRVRSAALSAVNLIDEFLSARKIHEGNFVLHPVPVSPAEAAESVVQNFSALAVSRGIELSLSCDGCPTQWKLDRLAFERVLGNLLSNALKFTPRGGGVTVSLRERGGSLGVTVTDTGSGMEAAEVQRLFERYVRLERHQDIPGTGLGLFIVKSIVSAHGGSIGVDSARGRGTSFELDFPAEPPVDERGEIICLSLG